MASYTHSRPHTHVHGHTSNRTFGRATAPASGQSHQVLCKSMSAQPTLSTSTLYDVVTHVSNAPRTPNYPLQHCAQAQLFYQERIVMRASARMCR